MHKSCLTSITTTLFNPGPYKEATIHITFVTLPPIPRHITVIQDMTRVLNIVNQYVQHEILFNRHMNKLITKTSRILRI